MQQRGVDIRELRDLAHGDTVNTVLGEELFGRVEDAFAGGKTALRPLGGLVLHQRAAKRAPGFARRAVPFLASRNGDGNSLHNRFPPKGTITVVVVVTELT